MTLAIYCAGGLGKEILALARDFSHWDDILLVDDVIDAVELNGARILRFSEVTTLGTDVEFLIANGEPINRKALYEKIKAAGFGMGTLISPYATLSPGVQVGEGCIVYDTILSVDVTVKENVLINTHVIVGHDAVIGANSVLSANTFIGGKTELGECVYMAPGSMAKDRITVGDNALVSLGAVLLRSVRPGAIMVGNPARHLGQNEGGKIFGMFDK